MANVYVRPFHFLTLIGYSFFFPLLIFTHSLTSPSTARMLVELYSSSMMTPSPRLQRTSESLPRASTALATRVPVSIVLFLSSCCREVISPRATVLVASPSTARSSRVGIPHVLAYFVSSLFFRRELHI